MEKVLYWKNGLLIVFRTEFTFRLRIINDEWTKGFQLWFGLFYIQYIKIIKFYDY
jgi:hypothetical protein